MQGTLLDQDVGDGAAALIQLGFEDEASGQTFGIGLKFQDIRCQQNGLQQVFNAFAGLGGYRNEFCRSAPVCGDQLVVGHFLFDLFNIGVGLIDLVDSNDDLNAGCLCMVDGLNGLRHDAVVRRYDKDRDIGGCRAAQTHGRERLMSGRIQEGNAPVVDRNGIGTDGLGNAAGFLAGHAGASDLIQKGGLTMVNVSHDTDDRGPLDHILFVLVVFLQEFFDHVDLFLLLAEDIIIHGDGFSFLIGDFAVDGHDLARQEELLNDFRSLQVHFLGQLTDGELLRDLDGLDLLFDLVFRLLFRPDEPAGPVLLLLVLLGVDQVLSGAPVAVLVHLAFVIFTLLAVSAGKTAVRGTSAAGPAASGRLAGTGILSERGASAGCLAALGTESLSGSGASAVPAVPVTVEAGLSALAALTVIPETALAAALTVIPVAALAAALTVVSIAAALTVIPVAALAFCSGTFTGPLRLPGRFL